MVKKRWLAQHVFQPGFTYKGLINASQSHADFPRCSFLLRPCPSRYVQLGHRQSGTLMTSTASEGSITPIASASTKSPMPSTQSSSNKVDPTGGNALALYNSNMSTNALGGINLIGGAATGAKYQSKTGRNNNPVVYVSFFDAMRFMNWLHNGQGSGGTESGSTRSERLELVCSATAKYWIPSEDEWYKAAYYDPSGVYYDSPTGSDTEPDSDNPASLNTPDNSNVANFSKNDSIANGYNDGYAVTGSTASATARMTSQMSAAYSGREPRTALSTKEENVFEWNEAVINPIFRGIRGGSWGSVASALDAFSQDVSGPSSQYNSIGFRVAGPPRQLRGLRWRQRCRRGRFSHLVKEP